MIQNGAQNLLLINSGDRNAFAALYLNGKETISFASEFMDGLHNKKPDKLINCVHKLSNGQDITNIDAIAVTIGPGSFTGIRVGLSIAKGLAFAMDKKIIPVNNFDLALKKAKPAKPGVKYCVLIPAKLPEYYYAVYENGIHLQSGCTEIEGLSGLIEKDVIIVGDFDDETSIKHSYFKYINVLNSRSESDTMLEISIEKLKNGEILASHEVEPLYLKDFIIRQNNRKDGLV